MVESSAAQVYFAIVDSRSESFTPMTLRQLKIPVDRGLLLTLGLTLFLALPLLLKPGLPNGPDVLYHSYRAAEMNRSWSHGLLLPSWAEGLYLGYGSPLFHFYARLAYIITSCLHVALGLDPLNALRTLLFMSLMLCGGGMYLFARRRFGRLGGVIAGLLYATSPWLMYSEAYARGTYPELLAFAIFPWLLWRIDALRDKPGAVNFAWLILLQVALINAHNLMAVVLTGVTLAWLLLETAIQHINREASRLSPRSSLLALLAIGLGMGVSASFWLPVLLESDSTHLENLTVAGLLDYRDGFVRLDELLSAPPINDAGAINGLRELKILGPAQWTLALLGALSGLWLYIRGYRTAHPQTLLGAALFSLLSLLMLALLLPSAAGIWHGLRPLQFLQFPWRLLGPVAACLAIVSAANGLWLERLGARWQISLVAIAVTLPVVAAIPLLYVPEWRHETLDTSLPAYHAEEVARRQLGTTFTDEYRPRHTHSMPEATAHLLADYADGYPIDKLNRAVLPAGATAEALHNSPQALAWRVNSEVGFRAEVYNFYWLGWRAEVDGVDTPIMPSPHHGLITFDMPPGEHRVRVYLGSTPARDVAGWISVAFMLLSAGIGLHLRQRRPRPLPYWHTPDLSRTALKGIMLGGGIGLLCITLFFREGVAWLESTPGEAKPARHQTHYRLDETLEILGYDLNTDVARGGDRLRLRVYWHATARSEIDFSSFLHLSSGGPPHAQVDKLHPGGRAISEWWHPGGYIIDDYELIVPADLPAGDYQLIVGLYTCALMPADDCGNGYRPTVRDASGEVIGDSVPLATIRVAS